MTNMNHRLIYVPFCLLIALLPGSAAQQKDSPQFTLSTSTEEILVNVTVRDKQGNFVKDLKTGDFTILEDGKPQQILSMDMENTDAMVAQDVQVPNLLGNLALGSTPSTQPQAKPEPISDTVFRDRRLIVLFFDLSSMQPEEIDRASKSALDYIDHQMAPADLVAVVDLANTLTVDEDFTSDRDELKDVINSFNSEAGNGFELGTDGSTDEGADNGSAYVVDDTESNIVNTDTRLIALQTLAATLGGIQQKKSVIYFASGMTRTGVENQSALRAATAAANRANLSFYPVDARGLQAIVPGGDATKASQRGSAAYTGRAMQSAYSSLSGSQETLVTLASDTGGKAFLDNNDFKPAFTKVLDDTSMYYVLGYRSNNPARDGKYRRITVTVKRPDVKLDFRRGYYAASDFQHTAKEDREQQLQDQLASDLPSTDLPVYMSTGYFRMAETRYYVPVSLIVPGSVVPFTKAGDQDKATIDVAGFVRDKGRRPFGNVRATVKLAVDTSQDVKRKNVQYNTGFFLPPGTFHLKFVLRENQTGQVGSFETDVTVPNLKDAGVKVSSVIASSQKQTVKPDKNNPLIRNGSEFVPSVTHVFSSAQHLYLYYEVYEPGRDTGAEQQKAGIRILTNVSFYKGSVKVLDTPMVEVNQINGPDRKAAEIELDVPLAQLKPGFYTCQVNVVDAAAGKLVFPRLALLVR